VSKNDGISTSGVQLKMPSVGGESSRIASELHRPSSGGLLKALKRFINEEYNSPETDNDVAS
jgi:hypothetical protein